MGDLCVNTCLVLQDWQPMGACSRKKSMVLFPSCSSEEPNITLSFLHSSLTLVWVVALNSNSELTQRALLVPSRDVQRTEVLLHAHEQILVTCRVCSAAAKENMNHDNLLLYNKSLHTLQVFTIIKALVGAGSETADKQLKYHLIRRP